MADSTTGKGLLDHAVKPKHLKRYRDLGRLVLRYGDAASLKTAGMERALADLRDDQSSVEPGKPEELASDLEGMGPTFVKLGQVLSTRTDIQAIPAAPSGMELPAFAARYPVPATHAAVTWLDTHGDGASAAACATCHARRDCTVCHQAALPPAVAALPEAAAGGAPGAGIRMRAPASHASAFFTTDHAGAAAAGTCVTCHGEAFCASCHTQAASAAAGPNATSVPPRVIALLESGFQLAAAQRPEPNAAGRGFHPASFELRHSTAAYGQTMECASCHNVEAFCRSCHVQVGLTPAARPGPGFHDATAVWLLGHGQAARQGMESCASCHRQRDCVQCHSTVGSFRVNPHGASFDAVRGWAQAPDTCLTCHLGNPLADR